MVELKSIYRTIIEIFKELKRHKIGIIGFTLLMIEIGLIIFFPIVADADAIKYWSSNLKYFEKNPRFAPPIWASYLFPWERPPTTYIEPDVIREDYDFNKFEGDDGYYAYYVKSLQGKWYIEINGTKYDIADPNFVREYFWPADKQRYSKVTIVKVIYTYNFYHGSSPIDVIFSLRLNLPPFKDDSKSSGKYFIGIYVHRPDGITLSLIPGSKYPDNIYKLEPYDFKRSDMRSDLIQDLLNIKPDGEFTLSLHVYAISKLEMLGETKYQENFVLQVIQPLLNAANITETGRWGTIPLVEMIFSKAEPGLLELRAGKLNGRYVFEFLFVFMFEQGKENYEVNIEADKAAFAGGWGLMGTDAFGRDLWTGIVYGIRWALLLGVVVALITNLTGTLYGVTSAYFGGKVDMVMQQIYRIYVSIPSFPILIMLSWSMGSSLWLLMSLMIIFNLTGPQYTVRSMALQIREQTYVEAARALGASHARILLRYIYPQVAPYLFASIALSVPGYILTEAGLSFLGLGDPTIVTWGKILEEAANRGAFAYGAWWWILFPGLAIVITSLAFIMFGQAIEKIIEPRLRTR
ncbi:MAG: ABC transporter permease [Desulfurococcaceae archaeon]